MTQIEEIASQVWQNGMTEQEFFQQLYAELRLQNLMVSKKISRDQAKVWKENRAGMVVCPYEEEWTKGLYISNLFKNEPIKIKESPATVATILSQLYHYRRYTNFPDYTAEEINRMNQALTDTTDVHKHEEGGFYFRMLQGWKKTRHSFARFQINADMNPEMIKDLDNFIKRHNSVYKTTPPEDWSGRTDSVNIYMYEPVTDDIKKEIVQIMSPYIRRSKPSCINSIDGEILADGIGFAREAHREECTPLVDRYPTHLKLGVRNYINSGVSLGTLRVAEEFLDMYQKYASMFRIDSKTQSVQTPVSQTQAPSSQAPLPSSTSSQLGLQDLLNEMRAIRSEIQAAHSELQHLRSENTQLKENLTGLRQENTRLHSQNQALRSQVQSASPVMKTPNTPTI